MLFENDFKEFLQILKEQNVRYLLVGAYAMGLHGTPRNTGDMDIWIDVTAANVEKLLTALNVFGFGSMGLAATDFLKAGNVVQLGYEPIRIDILTSVDGLTFEQAYANRKLVQHEGLEISLLGVNDLIRNKEAVGRKKDLGDIELLQRTQKKRNKGKGKRL